MFTGDRLPRIDYTKHFTPDQINYVLIETQEALDQAVMDLTGESVVALDTETNGFDCYTCKLFLVQVATYNKCYIINFQKVKDLSPLKFILEQPEVLVLGQNLSFDYKFLKHHTGIELVNIYDTMLAERTLTAGMEDSENKSVAVNLQAISLKYLNLYMDKSVRKTFAGAENLGHLTQAQLNYAAMDVLALFPIYTYQMKQLIKENLLQIADLESQCAIPVAEMEYNGCLLDVVKWREILAKTAVEKAQAEAKLMKLLPDGATAFNDLFGEVQHSLDLNSPAQLKEQLYKLGIYVESTASDDLKNYSHPAIKTILDYRKCIKTLDSFGENLLAKINKVTGRIHPSFRQYGADTGRFSCSEPNIQQIPGTSEFRSCFIAPPGKKLVVCDYSQCELRILAEYSGDAGFIKAFDENLDLHKYAASMMFGIPMESVTSAMRKIAKFINFGLAYGMGAGGLSVLIDKPVEECKTLIEKYFSAFGGVSKWLNITGKQAVKNRFATTMLGRKRFFKVEPFWFEGYTIGGYSKPEFRPKIGNVERAGKNTPIQGTNADMTKTALVYLHRALKGYDAKIINCVHDEVVVEVTEAQAEEVKLIVEREMLAAERSLLKRVPPVADANISDYWKK